MRMMTMAMLCASLLVAGCETMDEGGGYLTHSEHRLTASERAAVQAGMHSYLKVPVSVSGLKSSYRLSDGAVAVCGYVTGQSGGKSTMPSLFAGTLASRGGAFTPLRIPGQGQDPRRIATVRAFCQAEQIGI